VETESLILYSPSVQLYLIELVATLYEKAYFGFEESAHDYVEQIRNSIRAELPKGINHRLAPKELKHYGNLYAKIQTTSHTTWYVFFDKLDNRYWVGFITNNHTPQAQFLNLT